MANIQLKKVLSEPFLNKKDDSNSVVRIPDSYVDNLTIKDMITEFPRLVRGGQFVNAIEVIHGHGNFHWFYTLIEKVSKRLFCERERSKPLNSLDMSISSESEGY
jgi:hypothetical protein